MKKLANKNSKVTKKAGKKTPVKQPIIPSPVTCSDSVEECKIDSPTIITSSNKINRTVKGIPIELIIDYRNKNLSCSEIAKLLNCDKSNIVRRLQASAPELSKLESYKRNRADIFASIQARILNSITNEQIESAPLNVKTYTLGVIYDKERLERGQSTGNIAIKDVASHYSNEINKLSKQRQEIMQQLGMSTDTDTSADGS